MQTREWKIGPDEFKLLVEKLRFSFHKWDAYVNGRLKITPHSIVLSQEEHRTLVDITRRTNKILFQVERRVLRDPQLLKVIGIPEAVCELISCEGASEHQYARYDIIPTADGRWMIPEFNEDAPGGFNESVGIPFLGQGALGDWLYPDFANNMLNAIPSSGPIALMYATGYSEDLQHMLLLRTLLRSRGQEAVLCSPSQLEIKWGRPYVAGIYPALIFRFYPGEWFPLLPNLKVWRRAVGKVPLMNPLIRVVRQAKRLFALWEDVVSDKEDLSFIRSVTPETFLFENFSRERLIAEREDLVIKKTFGRMGDSVVIGALLKEEEWKKAVAEAEQSPLDFLVQRRFSSRELEFGSLPGFPAIGFFLINAEFAGYYTRTASTPFHTHEAQYVPTLIANS